MIKLNSCDKSTKNKALERYPQNVETNVGEKVTGGPKMEKMANK